MELFDVLEKRHSYRGKYDPSPVPREDLVRILEAGLAAPSGCNMQTTSLIAVDDPAVLEKLKAIQTKPVGATAPAWIVVLTERLSSYHGRCFAVQDYSAAIENMLLAIVSLGYESCWVEGYVTDADGKGKKMAEVLGVPEGYEVVCFLPVGRALAEPSAVKKKEFGARAWFNGFGAELTPLWGRSLRR